MNKNLDAKQYEFLGEKLIRFAMNGDIKNMKRAIKKGADIHYDYDSALQWAASEGHFDAVKFLVEQGADIAAKDYEAIHWASDNGEAAIVEYLESIIGLTI